MKLWKSPEMKLYSVKLSENIAASGGQTITIWAASNTGIIVGRNYGDFMVNGEFVQDTTVAWFYGGMSGDKPAVYEKDWGAIQGCHS